MTMWRDAAIDFYEATGKTSAKCNVIINSGKIALDIKEGSTWRGSEIAPGKYRLSELNGNGRATLYFDQQDETLVVTWIVGGEEGMSRIELSSAQSED